MCSSSFKSRSYFVPTPCLIRMPCTVGELTLTPSNSSWSERRTQPQAGLASDSASTRSTTSDGVVIGCVLCTGGRSLSPSSPWVWNRRFQS
mgnify:CR=1 FL=1